MKKIITILITLALITCQEPETDNTPIVAGLGLMGARTTSTLSPTPEIEPPIVPEPDTENVDPPEPEIRLPLFLTIANGENLFYYDGENLDLVFSGNFYIVDNETISKEDILYKIDKYGDTVSSIQLPIVCDFVEESGSDFYCIRIVSKTESLSFGAGNYNYAEIWKNYSKINDWWENKWLIQELIKTESGDIVAKTSMGAYHPISGNQSNIQLAQDEGLLIYNYDAVNRTASIKTSSGIKNTAWTTNYMNDAKDWILTDVGYLSTNGYLYKNNIGLLETETSLMNFNSYPYPISSIQNGQPPTIIGAGIRFENSEDVTYWIECNTGYIIRYVRSIDTITTPYRIYNGDGTQNTGTGLKGQLKPLIYENDLHYNYSGTIWKINLDTGLVSSVISRNAKFYLMR